MNKLTHFNLWIGGGACWVYGILYITGIWRGEDPEQWIALVSLIVGYAAIQLSLHGAKA